jgi:hypothetical protein
LRLRPDLALVHVPAGLQIAASAAGQLTTIATDSSREVDAGSVRGRRAVGIAGGVIRRLFPDSVTSASSRARPAVRTSAVVHRPD